MLHAELALCMGPLARPTGHALCLRARANRFPRSRSQDLWKAVAVSPAHNCMWMLPHRFGLLLVIQELGTRAQRESLASRAGHLLSEGAAEADHAGF